MALLLGCALLLATAATASAQQAVWLDGPTAVWNRAGAAVPAAPRDAPIAGLERCRERERAASGAEETAAPAAGWRLEEFWPTQRAGDVALVTATSGYDGMCRPVWFNGFVFAAGRFAGTIAPEPMASRSDGVLSGTPSVRPDGLDASFTRYAPSDPLCCPSRGHTTVSYRLEPGPVLAVARLEPRPPTPTQLPRTGLPAATAALAGAALALAGLILRR